MEKMKKLRVAMIGCGNVVHEYMDAYRNLPDAEIVAVVDTDPIKLEDMEKKWGIQKDVHFTDWKKMLKEVAPDAVNVCLSNVLHFAATIDAINAGCHALVEKPMAMSAAECAGMIAAARQCDVKLAVGFQQEFNPFTEFFIRVRDAGGFGKILFARGRLLRRRGIPAYGAFGQKEKGGGPLMDLGSHIIDVMHYVMGRPTPVLASGGAWRGRGNKPCEVVCANPAWNYKNYDVEDLAVGQVRFANDAVLQLETSYISHIKEEFMYEFSLIGEKGGGNWYSAKPPEIYTDYAGTMVNITPAWLPPLSRRDLFVGKIKNWLDACLFGNELRVPGEAGLATQQIIDGLFASAETGRETSINALKQL